MSIVIDSEFKADIFGKNPDKFFEEILPKEEAPTHQQIIFFLQLLRSHLLKCDCKANLITFVIKDQLWVANESLSRAILTNDREYIQCSVNSSQAEIDMAGPSEGMTNRITHYKLNNSAPEHLVIGSKALFEWRSPQEVVDIVYRRGNAGVLCDEIAAGLASSTEEPSAVVVVKIFPQP